MIISDKQQQANQQNAQHSTGPKSPEGKAAIRFNALTHGLRTRATILPGENAEDYYKLWDELEADWQPQNRTELCHLETMVTSQWLLARVAQSESRIYARIILGDKQFVTLAIVAKQRAQLERSFRTAIEDLKQLQKERQARRQPQPTQTAQTAQTGKTAPAPVSSASRANVPHPDYVMSEGTEAHPVFCSPITPDSR
jgi:hypothetical protein